MTTEIRTDAAYQINSRIVAETFEDDTVLIDVEKGIYYSMQGSASAVWHAFDAPRSLAAACDDLSAQLSDVDREKISQLITELVDRNLIVEVENAETASAPRLTGFSAMSFVAPVLSVFTDLADLIAIDPVHEVDEQSGWPVRPANPADIA